MMKINGLGFMGPSGDATPEEYANYQQQLLQKRINDAVAAQFKAPSAPATTGTPMRFGGK